MAPLKFDDFPIPSPWWGLTLRGAGAARAGEDGRHVFPKPGAVVFRRCLTVAQRTVRAMEVRLGSNKMGEHGNKCDLTWMMVMMQKDYTRHSHI